MVLLQAPLRSKELHFTHTLHYFFQPLIPCKCYWEMVLALLSALSNLSLENTEVLKAHFCNLFMRLEF